MKIVFFGTSAFAVPSLERITESGHDVTLVITQPDKSAGRGLRPQASAVKQAAERLKLPLAQPPSLTSEVLKGIECEAGVLAAYGKRVGRSVLSVPSRGILGVHPSLLPKYRGAAPVAWALLNGESVTGVTLYRLVERMDAGDILRQREVPIEKKENALRLTERLAVISAEELVVGLKALATDKARWTEQDESQATLASKLTKEQGRLDWSKSAESIERQVRALIPWPGTATVWAGKPVKLWEAEASEGSGQEAGRVLSAGAGGIVVAAGSGAVRITELQPAGGRRMRCREFLAGRKIQPGDRFGA